MPHMESFEHGNCAVCGMRDARLLTTVTLKGGESAVLCGSHELLHRRMGSTAMSVMDLKAMLKDRRDHNRRGVGEMDELAEKLQAAFCRERRGIDRRANP